MSKGHLNEKVWYRLLQVMYGLTLALCLIGIISLRWVNYIPYTYELEHVRLPVLLQDRLEHCGVFCQKEQELLAKQQTNIYFANGSIGTFRGEPTKEEIDKIAIDLGVPTDSYMMWLTKTLGLVFGLSAIFLFVRYLFLYVLLGRAITEKH